MTKSKDTPTTTPNKVPHDQIIDSIAGEAKLKFLKSPYKLIKLNLVYMTLLYLQLIQRKYLQWFHPSYLRITCLVYHLNQHTKVQINLPIQTGKSAFEGLSKFLNPMPIDVTFRDELPVFDKGKEIN